MITDWLSALASSLVIQHPDALDRLFAGAVFIARRHCPHRLVGLLWHSEELAPWLALALHALVCLGELDGHAH